MIPSWYSPTFQIGPLTLHTWGAVVAIGIVVAVWVAQWRAKRTGLDPKKIIDLAFWVIVAAFLGARIFHVFFYAWPYYQSHPAEIIRIDRGGLSSFGGFIGAVLAFLVFSKYAILDNKSPWTIRKPHLTCATPMTGSHC